jgi:hypothetical protein
MQGNVIGNVTFLYKAKSRFQNPLQARECGSASDHVMGIHASKKDFLTNLYMSVFWVSAG